MPEEDRKSRISIYRKFNHIHENPVRKGYVAHPEYWIWSSANPSSPLPIKFISA